MSALADLVSGALDAGTVPGAIALLGDGEPELVVGGAAALDGRPMRDDAIVRIQSMTKVITSTAALRFVASGRLDLDRSVVEWLPELADRRVLSSPTAELDDTEPARREITLRHLLTNTAGYGMALVESPLQAAMAANGSEVNLAPVSMAADEWLARLAELPLAFQPGEGWRYHHSFAILGILLSRVAGRPLHEHLIEDLFDPLGMADTGFWVPHDKLDRLTAALRHTESGFVETEPAGAGFYAGPPPFDVSHGELVSTVGDYHRFLRMLVGLGRFDGVQLLEAEQVRQLSTDQVPAGAKAADSFVPDFWTRMGWGWGVGVHTAGPVAGRYGWSGGQGTTFWVDPDGSVGILLTQVELGQRVGPLIDEFAALRGPQA